MPGGGGLHDHQAIEKGQTSTSVIEWGAAKERRATENEGREGKRRSQREELTQLSYPC